MNNLKSIKLNLYYIYGYYFFRSFIFAYVIERLFWESRGISITDTVYIEFVYAIVIVLTEIPSGVLADRLSRSLIIKISAFINLLSALLMVYSYGFMMFAIAISLSAIHGAFSSGSVNALLYDSLKELGEEDTFEKRLGRVKAIRYSSGLIAALIGSVIAQSISLDANYYLSFASTFISFILALMLTEPCSHTEEEKENDEKKASIMDIVKSSYSLLKNNNGLMIIMIYGAVIASMINYFEEFWQNYAQLLKVQPIYFGIISGLISLTVIVASFYSDKVISLLKMTFIKTNSQYRVLVIIMGAVFIIVGKYQAIPMLLLIAFASGVAAICENMMLGDIHSSAESDIRATVESVYSMIHRVLSIVVGLLFAYMSDKVDVAFGFSGIGYFSLIVFIILSIVGLTISRDTNKASKGIFSNSETDSF